MALLLQATPKGHPHTKSENKYSYLLTFDKVHCLLEAVGVFVTVVQYVSPQPDPLGHDLGLLSFGIVDPVHCEKHHLRKAYCAFKS